MTNITLPIYNSTGKTDATITLDPTVFDVAAKPAVLHQAITAHLANRRAATANTKGRGEVRGGGAKPWRQKGTGRARAGSSRSPIWIGGGTTFGPSNERNYTQRLPQKMRQLALKMALSTKVHDDAMVMIDAFEFPDGKTKSWLKLNANLPKNEAKTLLVVTATDPSTRTVRNLPDYKLATPKDVSTYDIVRYGRIVMTPESIAGVYDRLGVTPLPQQSAPKATQKRTTKQEAAK